MLLVSSLSLAGLSWSGHRRTGLLHSDREEVRPWLAEPTSPVTPLILLVALVLSIFVPAIGSWPLLALVLDDRLQHRWLRLRGKRGRAHPAAPGKAPAPRS